MLVLVVSRTTPFAKYGVGSTDAIAGEFIWDRIRSSQEEGMVASGYACHAKGNSFEDAMTTNRFDHVCRTAWCVDTRWWKPGRDDQPIEVCR